MFGGEDKIEVLTWLDTEALSVFQKAMGWVDYTQQSLFELMVQIKKHRAHGLGVFLSF